MEISREFSYCPQRKSWNKWSKPVFACMMAILGITAAAPAARSQQQQKEVSPPMELSRTVRPWEFLPITGTRAALFGSEAGGMEAWVYPLKIFREFHLHFLTEGRVLSGETLARTLTVRPESATILYAGDTFTVRETLFVPVDAQGAIIVLNVETEQPLEIEAAFHRDFQLEWPAALGAAYIDWSAPQHAFYFGEEQRKFAAFVGSPTAADPQREFQTNYSESQSSSFRLGATEKGKETKLIVVAASMEGRPAAEKMYQHLTADYPALLEESRKYYQDYLARTVSLELPDAQLQQAYDWARISEFQGRVSNPYLGTGLVAGYRTSGESQRPGFAWFFGRDSFWTALALDAAGDFSTVRTALAFISKFQRDDGTTAVLHAGRIVPVYRLTAGLTAKLIKLHIPVQFREIVIAVVTTGGSTNPKDYPIAAGHAGTIKEVFNAAASSAGRGIHLSLEIGAAVVLLAAVIALFASRRPAATVAA